MKEYPKIKEERKKQLIEFMEKYRKKGEINRKVIVKTKKNQNEYDFMHDWLKSNNIEIIGSRVDEYDYTEPLEEKEISEERKEFLIKYLKENTTKDRIPEHLLFVIQKNDNELDFMYDWLEENDITITGINGSLIGEISNFKNIFRDGKDIDLPDYEPLPTKKKEQLKYSSKKIIKNNSISNDELLKITENELEYLYVHDWLKKNQIEIKNIDSKHKNIKKSYKQAAYEESNKMDIELFKKMEQGDKSARNKIIEHNLRLASWVVHDYKSFYDNILNVEEEDKLHYARIGLIKAVDRFDYKKGFKFSTYAVQRMKWDIDRYLYKELLIKTPVYLLEQIRSIKRIEENLEQKGIKPTNEIILEMQPELRSSEIIGELRQVAKLINYESLNEIDEKRNDYEGRISRLDDSQNIQEIDDEIFDDGIYLEDEPKEKLIEILINDIQEENTEKIVDKAELKRNINKILSTLTEREEQVLRLRFGLDDGRERSLEEVAQMYKVTRERIRQIEAKALRKLRHPMRSQKVRDYLDDYSYITPYIRMKFMENNNSSASYQVYQVGLENDFEKNLDEFASFSNGTESEMNNDYDDEVIEKKPEIEFEELLEHNTTEETDEILENEKIEETTNNEKIIEKEDNNSQLDIKQIIKRAEEIKEELKIKKEELMKNIHNKEILKTKKEEIKALYNELEEIRKELDKNEDETEK